MASGPAERGLQRERTSLAWDRTGVAFMVVGALMLRVGGPPYLHIARVPAILTIILGAGLIVAASRLFTDQGTPVARPTLISMIGLATTLVSISSLGTVLLVR